MTTDHWVYYTRTLKNGGETTHLADFDRVSIAWSAGRYARTLCGQTTRGMAEGDETLSGHVATCGVCLRKAGRDA